MKWKTAVLTVLVIGAAASAAGAVRSFAAGSHTESAVLPDVEERFTQYDSAAYILRERNGYVAVFSSNPTQPVECTNIAVSSLRKADQLLLQEGIAAADWESVLALLEDLGS